MAGSRSQGRSRPNLSHRHERPALPSVEIRAAKHLIITPNTIVTVYDTNDQGVRPRTDFHIRLTFFLNFEH